jgi:mRNA interferase RelE/StbE
MGLFFTQSAFRQFQKLNRSVQKRIDEKLRFYLNQKNPLQFAESLKDSRFGDWRFRIGDYRVIFDLDGDKIIVLKIGHRKDVYR